MSRRLDRLRQLGAVFVEPLDDIDELEKRYSIIGSPTPVDTPLGSTGLSFDGVNDWIDTDIVLPFSGEISVCAYVKTDSVSANSRIVSNATVSDPRWILYFNSDGEPTFFANDNVASGNIVSESSSSYDDGDHHLIVATMDDTSAYIYVDGSSVGSDTGNTITSFTPSGSLELGSYDSGTDKWGGILKNIIIFNRALSEDEVEDMYKGKLI